MSILKARRLPLSNKPELEGSVRELVRRESSAIRPREIILNKLPANLHLWCSAFRVVQPAKWITLSRDSATFDKNWTMKLCEFEATSSSLHH